MAGLGFSSHGSEQSHEHELAAKNVDVPIDPVLGGPQIDPQLTGEQPVASYQAQTNLDFAQVQPPQPQHPLQYSDAPQGDPFAPLPEQPPYTPSPRLESTPKAPKRKRKNQRCSICSGSENRNNKTGEPEHLISCEECGLSVHATCSDVRQPANIAFPWRCIECKICESCGDKGDDSRILFCDRCERGWHMHCLVPPLEVAPDDVWYCPLCVDSVPQDDSEEIYEVNGKGKGRAVTVSSASSSSESDESDASANAAEEPVQRKRRGRKPRETLPSAPVSVTPRKRQKQRRPKVQQQSIAPPTIRIRLKRGELREEEEKGLFDDILTVQQRDVSKTSIGAGDKQRFERIRSISDNKVAAYASSAARDSEQPEAGPSSRPLRSSTLQQINTAPSSQSPAPSTPGAWPLPGSKPPSRIQSIRFGEFDIKTWYDAPFPEEYANIPDGRLWFCEFCLKYMKSRFGAERHRMKCKCRHPPGDEIYRDGPISIFEVDGRRNKIYCQNLCLLSKMFLDHKSLFYDVEPFLFYVVTETNDAGARFVGYFSKEKRSPKDYNVSCIMTLPVRQRQGWGNLLIDFSYLLSKKEQRLGSPEKPLSALGAIGYRNYWTLAVIRYLQNAPEHPRLEDISAATSMTIEDVHVTLVQQGMISVNEATPPRPSPGQSIKYPKGRKNGVARKHLERSSSKPQGPFVPPTRYEITWDKEKVEQYLQNWESKGHVRLKPEKLKWSPFIISRTQKTEAMQATATTDLVTTAVLNGDPSAPSKSTATNGDVVPEQQSHDSEEHISSDELPVAPAVDDKGAVRTQRDRMLLQGKHDRSEEQADTAPPPAKRPRGRPKKVVDVAPEVDLKQPEPVHLEDTPRQLRSRHSRKHIDSSSAKNGHTLSFEPHSNGINSHAINELDIKSEGSSTPGPQCLENTVDQEAIFTADALLGLKSADYGDMDADGDYDEDDTEMKV